MIELYIIKDHFINIIVINIKITKLQSKQCFSNGESMLLLMILIMILII